MSKNIIDSLDNINKLIEEEKYQEAINYIEKTKEEIKTGKDVSNYMDSLINDLKQKFVEKSRKMSKNVEAEYIDSLVKDLDNT